MLRPLDPYLQLFDEGFPRIITNFQFFFINCILITVCHSFVMITELLIPLTILNNFVTIFDEFMCTDGRIHPLLQILLRKKPTHIVFAYTRLTYPSPRERIMEHLKLSSTNSVFFACVLRGFVEGTFL